MKKRVLFFGSGNGALEYFEKYKDEIELVVVLDNDKSKHGSLFLDKFLIVSPNKISEFEYEQIIIVSQWAKDIKNQLLEDLQIENSKIVTPKKSSIKNAKYPFEDIKTIELARTIIKELSTLAIQDNLKLLVDFGTLLGIIRDKDIIEWDDDIDFAIIDLPNNFDFELWITKAISKMNLPVKFIITKREEIDYILTFENISNDHTFKSFITSISFRKVINENSIHLPSNGMWYAPKYHFESYEVINWQDTNILVPYKYKEYLTFVYGDWQKPKKNISMEDYEHLGTFTYENFKN